MNLGIRGKRNLGESEGEDERENGERVLWSDTISSFRVHRDRFMLIQYTVNFTITVTCKRELAKNHEMFLGDWEENVCTRTNHLANLASV